MSTARPQEARPVLRLPSRSRAVPTATRMATRRVPALALPAIALLLGGGVVVAAQASGHWATTGRDALTSSVAQPSGSDGEPATSKRSSTAVATLLTFCPPGPDARTKRSTSSSSSMWSEATCMRGF